MYGNDKRIRYRGAIHENIVKIGGELKMLSAAGRIQIIFY